jgi:dipeptidyl aminopeptidase/acylaminoacyl peptidase
VFDRYMARTKGYFLLSLICLVSSMSLSSRGQELPVADMVEARSFGSFDPLAPSPDGSMIAYVLRENGDPGRPVGSATENKNPQRLWLLDLRSGTSRRLTGPEDDSMPEWSADGHLLAFCREYVDRTGHQQHGIWVWERASQKLRQVMGVTECGFRAFQWSPDGRRLYVKIQTARTMSQSAAQEHPGLQQPTVRLYKSAPPDAASTQPGTPWNIDRFYDLFAVEVRGGHVNSLLNRSRIAMFWVSPNGSAIVLALTKRFEKLDSTQLLYDLIVLDLSTEKTRTLASDVRLGAVPITVSWSPASDQIAYRESGILAAGGVDILSISQPSARNIAGSLHPEGCDECEHGFWGGVSMPPVWGRDGKHVFFADKGTIWDVSAEDGKLAPIARFEGKQVELLESRGNLVPRFGGSLSTLVIVRDDETHQIGFSRLDVDDGETVELFRGDFDCVGPFDIVVTGNPDSVVYVGQNASSPQDLWTLRPESKQPIRLTTINPKLMNYTMGLSRLVSWRSLDGQALHGALLLPSAYNSSRRYPLVVGVYGGSYQSEDVNKFGLEGCFSRVNAQLLATRGFAVLCPDSPQHKGTPMYDLAQTVLPGVDKVVEMGIADANRIGVMGQSYGGYSALALVTQTNRFRAAVVTSGFGDLFSLFGEMQEDGSSFAVPVIEEGQGLMGGSPWQVRSKYIENSPFFYLDRVHTPVLLLEGEADTTSGAFLADQTFVGLRRLGATAVYAKYQGEGHSPSGWSPSNQEDYLSRVVDWFERYLLR